MTVYQNVPVLKARELFFNYPDRPLFTQLSVNLLSGINLVKGGDGRGKSTLLKLLAGAVPAQSGELTVKGIDSQSQPAQYQAHVFWTDSRSDAHDQMTALAYFELQRSKFANFNDAVLSDMTDGLGLNTHLHKQLFMLSTGSKRKVFLAAAFASQAAVTLLDEPFAALDAVSIEFVLRQLQAAALNGSRSWVIADYVAPDGLALVQITDLGD